MADTGLFLKHDNTQNIVRSVKALVSRSVYVGYPDSGAARKDAGDPSNAVIAFIQEHGSPAANIPARAFMVPGIKSIQSRALKLLEQAATAALSGEQEKSTIILNQLGLIGVAAVQRAITVGEGWPPLSERTLAARRARGVQRTHPLIDTGQLRQHVEYVIREKSGKNYSVAGTEYLTNMKRA